MIIDNDRISELRKFLLEVHNELNKNEPMKNIIKQIEKIKGVVTVEKAGENMAVVVFEPKQEKWAGREYVECTTEEQFEFVKGKTGLMDPASISYWVKYPCVSTDGKDCFSSQMFPERAHRIIDFGKYVSNRNLKGEWREFSKPKSLSPDELVDGKIYVDGKDERTIRVKSLSRKGVLDLYSQHIPNFNNGGSLNSTSTYCLIESKLREATVEEKKSHIKFEIERDYFHELKIN